MTQPQTSATATRAARYKSVRYRLDKKEDGSGRLHGVGKAADVKTFTVFVQQLFVSLQNPNGSKHDIADLIKQSELPDQE
jgi:hypothetical protein